VSECDVDGSYLEELSRRYRRQMEEMYSSLNRTISKLSNTAKIAAEQVTVCFLHHHHRSSVSNTGWQSQNAILMLFHSYVSK